MIFLQDSALPCGCTIFGYSLVGVCYFALRHEDAASQIVEVHRTDVSTMCDSSLINGICVLLGSE